MSKKYNFLTNQVNHIATHFDVPLSENQKRDMNLLWEITAHIDNVLDGIIENSDLLHQMEDSILSDIQNGFISNFFDLNEDQYLLLATLVQNSVTRQKFYSIIKSIFYCQKQMRGANNLIDYVKWRYREGAYSADLCLLVTDINDVGVENYGRQLMGYVNLTDSAFDLSRDYRNGEISFKPSILMQLKLAIVSYQKMSQTMKHIANKTQKDIGQTIDGFSFNFNNRDFSISFPFSGGYRFSPE